MRQPLPPLPLAARLALALALLALASCAVAVRTGPYPEGPRDGAGMLVDPRTGIELPGQWNGGF